MDQQNGQPTATGKPALEDWRRQIDALDTELLRLLNQRAAIACEIALVKVASGLPAYDGNRESQVLARVAEKNSGPLDRQSVTAIFRGIIRRPGDWARSACRNRVLWRVIRSHQERWLAKVISAAKIKAKGQWLIANG